MDLPVESFLENLGVQGGCSQQTLKAYANDTQQFAGYIQSILNRPPQITDFNTSVIDQYFEYERDRGHKPSTLLRRRASIRRLALYLHENQLIDEGPNIGDELEIDLPKKRHWLQINSRRLTFNDIENVLEVIRNSNSSRALRDSAILSLLSECGLSIGTLLLIDINHFNVPKHTIYAKAEELVQGNWLHIPKSSPLISEYLREGRPNLTDSKVETALFVSQMGGRISRQSVWQSLQNWAKLAKMKNRFTPRSIRYVAVEQMLANGLSVKQIQSRIGHKNIFSTYALIRRITK